MGRTFNINTNIPMATNDNPGKLSVEHYKLLVGIPARFNSIDSALLSKASVEELETVKTLLGQIQSGYLKKVIVDAEPENPENNTLYYQPIGDGKYTIYSYIDGVKIELGDTDIDTSNLATKDDLVTINQAIDAINEKLANQPVNENVVLAGRKTW